MEKYVLWFDVGIKRYTTQYSLRCVRSGLWFDVGIKRYTTQDKKPFISISCGLM